VKRAAQVLAAAVADSPVLEAISLTRNMMGDVCKALLLEAWEERCTPQRYAAQYIVAGTV
jgi:hypothetical protein